MGRCLLVLVGMGDGKVLLVWDGEVPTCLLLSRMGRFLLVSSYPGWEVSYLSPPRWNGEVSTCPLLGVMGNRNMSTCPLLCRMGGSYLSSPRWDGEVSTCPLLGGMGEEKVSTCLLLGGMADDEVSTCPLLGRYRGEWGGVYLPSPKWR
jgi:hypothetical protein